MTTGTVDALQDSRLVRYAALREDRPELFRGKGPVRLDADRVDAGVGVVHADPWIMLIVDPVVMPDGREGRYGRLVTTIDAEGVAVLPMTTDGRVLLLRHWRHATQQWHLEIVRGFGEPGLLPIAQAAAELKEELDVEGVLTPLGHIHPDTGMLASRVALFVATIGADAVPSHLEGLATVVEMTVAGFEDAVMDGSVTDSFALAAWARHSMTRSRAV